MVNGAKYAIVTAAFIFASSATAHAGDPRCDAPPYGGTIAGFKAFVKDFGAIVVPANVLPAVCNAKFGGDRTALYNLGFTDHDIDAKDTEELAVEMIVKLNKLMNK